MNQLYERRNPHRLFRDRENGMLAGVCAGIAEYFGLNRKGVRLVTVLLMLFPPFFAFVVISYVILAIVLPAKPADLYESKEQAEFCIRMIRRPADDVERTDRVWTTHVHSQRDAYEMSP